MKGSKKQQFYENFASSWEENMNMDETNKRIKVVFDQLLEGVELKGKRFLEVGHGLGYFSKEAAARGAKVTGIDLGKNLAKISQKRVPKGKFLVASADNLPFKDETFDIVLCTEVMEHMDDPVKALDEIYRVTKEGGKVIITTPNKVFKPLFAFLSVVGARPYNGNEKWFFPWTLKKEIESRNFKVLKEKYFNFIYPNEVLDQFENNLLSKYITINQGYLLSKTTLSLSEESEKEHFNLMAKKYDSNYGYNDEFTQYKIDKKMDNCRQFVVESFSNKKIKILEIGCGTGEYTVRLARMFPNAQIVGIDISDKIVDIAKEKSKGLKNVKYFAASAYDTKFKNNSFDVICGFYILHHLDIPKIAVETKRLIKKKGIGFFYEPNLFNPVVFLIKKTPYLKKKVGDSPGETAINPISIQNDFDKFSVEVMHTEFIFPTKLLSSNLLIAIDKFTDKFGRIPILKYLSGSLLVKINNK